jgi:uncharacterized membrane protein YeaQ/YmgE (transglycosylase-associated protein family)
MSQFYVLILINKRNNIMGFLWFLLVGLIAGWLAGMLVKGGGFGVVGDMIVGVLGAFIGGFLFTQLGVSSGGGMIGSIIVATIGAIILIFILRLIKRA